MKSKMIALTGVLCAVLAFGLIACGGSGGGSGGGGGKKKVATYTIGGIVNGLSGSGLVLEDNGADDLIINSSGSFTFTTPVANGKDYAVTVLTQPSVPNQTCSISNSTGTVSGTDVTNVTVTCSTLAYSIGGTVSGLEGSGLVLQDNGVDDLIINASGPFMFNAPVADTAGYVVTVLTQPSSPNQTCTVNNATGFVNGTGVTDVTVTCSTIAYDIGGMASGITNTVVLQNNGGDDLTINADGPFVFNTPVADTADYDVTILSSPWLGCALTNASGTVSGADVTDVALTCTSISVEALYPNNGLNWNDYVQGGNITNATDTTCDALHDTACLHGGELRAVEVPGVSLCNGVSATDSLGAFDWTCDENTEPVRVVSTGLKDGKYLSDLIDFDTPDWKTNSVTVNTETNSFSTSPAKWWTNPVAAAGDGTSTLNTSGTIYVVTGTDDLASGFIIGASKVGLVAQPGAIINGPGSAVDVVMADGKNFLWLEGNIDASADNNGVYLISVNFSMLDNVQANNAEYYNYEGVLLYSSSNNTLRAVTAANNNIGIYIDYYSNSNMLRDVTAANNNIGIFLNVSSNNTLWGVTSMHNDSYGVYIMSNSKYNVLSGVTASDNAQYGVYLFNASSNTFNGVTVANNSSRGFSLYNSAYNVLSGVTAANNSLQGFFLQSAPGNVLSGITSTNNYDGFYLYQSSNNTFSGLTAANNIHAGVDINSSSYNYFTGALKVGKNAYRDCTVLSGTDPGLVNISCDNNGSSDATLTKGVTLASSFVGKAYDDSVNSSDTGSAVAYPADPATFDWLYFEYQYRGWGPDGLFTDVGSQGPFGCSEPGYYNQTDCESNSGTWNGNGAIWDWSLLNSDTEVRDALALPSGDDTLTHTWSDASTTTFLKNAVEIMGDGIGNDNLLCESGETCLFTPNMASYQGHGDLVDAGYIGTGGTLEDITLMKYETNGR